MFLNLNKQTDLDTFISAAFRRYRDILVETHEAQRKQEDIQGESTLQYVAAQYQMAIGLVVLIRLDVDKNVGKDWDYYVDKYKLEDIGNRLSCVSIDLEGLNETNFQAVSLNNILSDFGLPSVQGEFGSDVDGIEGMSIESTFEIEPDAAAPAVVTQQTINIQELLDTPTGCNNTIESACT